MTSRDAAEASAEPVSPWNVANALTVLRLVMVPAFVWALFVDGGEDPVWRVIACVIFTAAIVTDVVDGKIARSRGLVTDFGKIVDPIADKALTGAAFVGLSILGWLPWWVTAVVLVREFGITVLRFVIIRHGVMAASHGGKLKTTLQAVALGGFILPLALVAMWLHWAAVVVMAAAVIVTVATGLEYVFQAITMRKDGLAREAEAARADGSA